MLCGKDNQPSQIEKHASEMQAKAIKIQGFFFLVAFFFFPYLSGCWLWRASSRLRHVGSSLLTRSGPQALCIWGVES